MDAIINNTSDLRLEIERLKQKQADQELVIKQHFNSPRAILGTLRSLFYKPSIEDELTNSSNWAGKDVIGWLSRLLLPITLNKTLFRKSNFIVKALVGLASQKASAFVNDKSVGTLWDKIKTALPDSLVEKLTPKKKKRSLYELLPPAKKLDKKLL